MQSTPTHSTRRRPRITVKYAQTLDGRIATANGHSRWVSGPESRLLAHRLRAEHDAVLVGVGTVIADDPQLTVRLCDGTDPLRVIVDTHLRIPAESIVVTDGGRTLLATTVGSGEVGRALPTISSVTLPARNGHVDLRALFEALQERGIGSVLVEGGGKIITSLMRDQLVDETVIIIAAKIVGMGIDGVGDLGILAMENAVQFDEGYFTPCGADMVFRGRPIWNSVRSG